MSKVFNATLATSVVVGSGLLVTPAQAESISFTDVKEDSIYYQAIIELAKIGAIEGSSDSTFKPGDSITRGQVTEILSKVLNFQTVETSNEPITRAEMASLLANAFYLTTSNTEELPFKDVDSDDAEAIKSLYDNGVTTGTSNTTYSPDGTVTREQAALFIYRALNVSPQTKAAFELKIMHSNDTHSRVEQAAKRAQAVKDVRAKNPDALLLDAGDMTTGTLYYNLFNGQADLEFFNYMKYDAVTFGNHEFDAGSSDTGLQTLVDYIKGADFPFVSSNIDFTQDEKFTGLFSDLISSEPENGKIYNGIVKEVNGEKVGIFGLTTAETADISSPGALTFENYLEEAEKAVKAFEGLGVNKIIVLSHLGYDDNPAIDNDQELAKRINGIDVIVGGHSHTKLDAPVAITTDENGEAKDTTLIVQAYQHSDFLGTLDVGFDENGVVVDYNGKLIALGDYAEDPKALEILKPYQEEVKAFGDTELGVSTEVELSNPRVSDEGNTEELSVRKNETILGNLITDGMLAKAKQYTEKEVIMALQNGGGIRAAIDAGPITVGEVNTVLPFGNTLAIMDVTGAELKAAFEHSLGQYPSENGGFLHVAGAKVEFDSTKPAGERVVSIAYLDASGNYVELEDSKTYTVATNAFTAKGGDGFTMFGKAYEEGRVTDLGLSDWENLSEHLQSLEALPTETEGRIVDISVE